MRTDRLKVGRQFRLECVRREFESERDDEDAACQPPNLPLEDALQLVHLYAERGSPKFERAAMRWLERCLAEVTPRLRALRRDTAGLAKLGG